MKSIIDKILETSREREFIAKVGSLVLSVILWAYISNIKTGELRFKINLTYKGLPKKYIVSHSSRSMVSVKMIGKKDHLKNVNVKNLKLFVELNDAKPDTKKKYRISISKNQIPESIKISVLRKYVELTIEKKVIKKVKIIPQYNGNLKTGAVIGKIKIKPDFVFITGAKSKVDKINSVSTETISLENASDDIIREVELKTSEYKNISFNETNAKVWIPIIRYNNLLKHKSDIVIRNRSENYIYKINKKSVRIFLKGTGIDSLKKEDLNVFVNAGTKDIKALLKNSKKKELSIKVPVEIIFNSSKKIDLISKEPSKVLLTISKK